MTQAAYTLVRMVQNFEALESRDTQPWVEELTLTAQNLHGTKVSFKWAG